MSIRGLSRVSRTPKEAVRDRRNAQAFSGAMSLMFEGAVGISDEGLIVLNLQTDGGLDQDTTGLTIVVQDPILLDALGVGLNYGTGLGLSGSDLVLDILGLTTDTIAAGDWVPFHDLADAPNKIAFSDFEATLNHDALTNFLANEHIDWTDTTENLLTTGNITIDSDTSRIIFGDAQDASMGWDDASGFVDVDANFSAPVFVSDIFASLTDGANYIDASGDPWLLVGVNLSLNSLFASYVYSPGAAESLDMTANPWVFSGSFSFIGTVLINADITISLGSIISASGTISFGDENLVTTGSVGIGTATPFRRLDIVGDATDRPDVRATRYSADGQGPIFTIRKARGTVGAPGNVVNTDEMCNFGSWGMQSGNFKFAGYFACVVDGNPVGAGVYRVPSMWRFYTVEQGDTTAIHKRFVIRHDGTIDCQSGDVITTGTVTGGGAKVHLTPIGGIAVELTNKTGAASVAGQLVKADPATDDAVILTAAGDDECMGIFLDSGIADGSEAWVVVAGIADVAMEDNTAATRGNWVETSDTVGEEGYADATAATPAAAPAHFEEIGHCIESVAAGGGGTHILARCVLHFN